MRKLKLIWDFHGPNSSKTAEHHEIHLKEYIKLENLDIIISGCQDINDMHAIAFLVVKEQDMKPIRDTLKPHRGEVYNAMME